jgi:hypothetical protein
MKSALMEPVGDNVDTATRDATCAATDTLNNIRGDATASKDASSGGDPPQSRLPGASLAGAPNYYQAPLVERHVLSSYDYLNPSFYSGNFVDAYNPASESIGSTQTTLPTVQQEWYDSWIDDPGQPWYPDLLHPDNPPTYPSDSNDNSSDMLHRGRDTSNSVHDPSRSTSRRTGSSSGWDQLPEFDITLHSDDSDLLLISLTETTQQQQQQQQHLPGDLEPDHDLEGHNKGESPQQESATVNLGKRKRRGFQPNELQKVNSVRRESACIRCQILKEPCGKGCPCPRCLDINATATIWRGPCFKGRITDVELFRTRALSFPNGVRRIQAWASPRKSKVSLYNVGFGGNNPPAATRPKVSIICQEFSPLANDVLFKKWTRSSETVTLTLPAYAIPPKLLTRTSKSLSTCVDENWELLVGELEFGQDEVIKSALREAIRCHHKSTTIHDALTICIITRLASKSFNLTGKETLGIGKVDDPVSPYYGRMPIPPLLDAQIDQIWMEKMGRIKKKMLSELKKKIMGRKHEDWYHIFLTLFVLIANLEFIYQVQNDQLNRYCLNVSYQPFFNLRQRVC